MIYHTTDDTVAYEPGSSYGTFRDLDAAVLRAVRRIERCTVQKFDMIVVQGVSGMSLGFPLALKLGIDICVVRKDGENNHCGDERITGSAVKGKKLLFVDDFVSSGLTRQRVRREVEAAGGKVVGEYTSRDDLLVRA